MAGTRVEVTELYVATFNRAPESTGIDYWVASSLTIEEIAQSFFEQPETQALYGGTITNPTDFVTAIYNNMFNRPPEQNGLDYWVSELDSGNITPGNMILAIANGAQGTDDSILTNKTLVGLDFADSGLSNYADSVFIMSGITEDSSTVTDAAAQIQIWEGESNTQNFTTERDTLPGTDGSDLFLGAVNGTAGANTDTFQAFDAADGGAGDDILHITSDLSANRLIGAASITNIETLHITQNLNGHLVVDASNFDDKIDHLVIDGSATSTGHTVIGGGPVGTNLDAVLDSIELSVTNASQVAIVRYEASAVAGVDSSEITLTNGVAQTLISNGVETYTVHTGSGLQQVTIADGNTLRVNIDGGADLTLSTAAVTTVDASAALGSFNNIVGGSSTTTTASTILGGSVNDTIIATGTAIIAGNGGADQLTSSGTGTIFKYNSHNDSTLTNMDSVLGFVSGTDKINVTDAITASGGSITGTSLLAANAGGGPSALAEGNSYIVGGSAGVTHAYKDTVANILYVDINQDNTFNAADDLMIQFNAMVAISDIIV